MPLRYVDMMTISILHLDRVLSLLPIPTVQTTDETKDIFISLTVLLRMLPIHGTHSLTHQTHLLSIGTKQTLKGSGTEWMKIRMSHATKRV